MNLTNNSYSFTEDLVKNKRPSFSSSMNPMQDQSAQQIGSEVTNMVVHPKEEKKGFWDKIAGFAGVIPGAELVAGATALLGDDKKEEEKVVTDGMSKSADGTTQEEVVAAEKKKKEEEEEGGGFFGDLLGTVGNIAGTAFGVPGAGTMVKKITSKLF